MEKVKIDGPFYWHLIPELFNGEIEFLDIIVHFKNGQLDKEDGPAIIYKDGPMKGSTFWYKGGMPHRIHGPAKEVYHHGHFYKKEWYFEGFRHSPEKIFDMLSDEEREKAIWRLNEWK